VSARRLPAFVAALFFTLRDSYTVDNTVDLYAAKPDIRPESRFLPTPPAFDAPVRGGGSRRNITTPFGTEKLDGEKILKICLFVLTRSTNVTDGRTDTA